MTAGDSGLAPRCRGPDKMAHTQASVKAKEPTFIESPTGLHDPSHAE
jgi:hypothetical protein